jgi:predicted RecA/RadA family phage recombinase
MATNFLQEGRILTLAAPVAAVVSGQPVMWGNLFGVCLYSAAIGSPVEVQVDGVWALPKTAGIVFAAGALVYWDPIALSVTSVSTSNHLIGAAVVPAVSGAATATVRLNGTTVV